PNALTISLEPLSEAETREFVGALADPSLLVDAAEDDLLARAGGNPLYAQEYVRMVVDRGADAPAVPESVQGIIAARLDALPAEEKSLLQDAQWSGIRAGWAPFAQSASASARRPKSLPCDSSANKCCDARA